MRRTLLVLVLGFAALLSAGACGSVPEVVFVSDDAGVSAGDSGPSIEGGGAEAGAESGAESGTETGGSFSCPGSPPPGLLCCSQSYCSSLNPADCPEKGQEGNACRNDCENNGCPRTSVCCRAAGAFVACVPVGQPCP